MFAALFSSIFELIIFIGLLVALYQTFLSDWIAARRQKIVESKARFSNVEKIAQLKLVSVDPKDIEQFVSENATYLSDSTVSKLVGRLETLRSDQVIAADDILKKRIDDLQPPEEKEEEHAQTIRS